jgi:hypothetical protein
MLGMTPPRVVGLKKSGNLNTNGKLSANLDFGRILHHSLPPTIVIVWGLEKNSTAILFFTRQLLHRYFL